MSRPNQSTTYPNSDSLISTAELAEVIASPNVRVVEAAFDMPGAAPPTSIEKFREGHIPGAVFFDIDEISDKESPLPHMIPSAGKFSRDMGNLGIGSEDRVIVYDREGLKYAPRAWWMFRTFGHTRVSVLNGGLAKWQAEGRDIERGITPKAPRAFNAKLVPGNVRRKTDVAKIISDKNEQLIDARCRAGDVRF